MIAYGAAETVDASTGFVPSTNCLAASDIFVKGRFLSVRAVSIGDWSDTDDN